jgi:integrase
MPIFPRLAENNVRTGFVDDRQYRKLVEHGKELWFRTILEVARTYGWRKREVTGMRVNQVDLLRRTIRLEPGTTKNKEGREVSMTESVYTLLSACVAGKAQDAYVFTRDDGGPVRDFRKTWANACCAAGLGRLICGTCSKDFPEGKRCPNCKSLTYKGLIVHDLRRTAARNLRRAGVAEGVIQKIGGWKTRSVFERYNIVRSPTFRTRCSSYSTVSRKPSL